MLQTKEASARQAPQRPAAAPKGFNRLVATVLRSPLHAVLSGRVLLITVTGRRSGTRYTTPVEYTRDGSTITVFSRRSRSWWRNLRGCAPVTMRLRGRELAGTGEVIEDEENVVFALSAARPELLDRLGPRTKDLVLVRVHLDGDRTED